MSCDSSWGGGNTHIYLSTQHYDNKDIQAQFGNSAFIAFSHRGMGSSWPAASLTKYGWQFMNAAFPPQPEGTATEAFLLPHQPLTV